MVINKHKNIFHSLAKIDSITTYQENAVFKLNNTPLKINEFRNDTKNIIGYECFKIKFTVEEILNEVFKTNKNYTMYVTDRIKSIYHPVTYFKSVLDKYYPLEVYEENKGISGVRTEYKIKKIESLKN